MPRAVQGWKDFTEYERGAGNQTIALGEWKRTLDKCDGDGFRAARVFQKEQPALFKTLEASGKTFEELCEIAALMSSNYMNGPGEYF